MEGWVANGAGQETALEALTGIGDPAAINDLLIWACGKPGYLWRCSEDRLLQTRTLVFGTDNADGGKFNIIADSDVDFSHLARGVTLRDIRPDGNGGGA